MADKLTEEQREFYFPKRIRDEFRDAVVAELSDGVSFEVTHTPKRGEPVTLTDSLQVTHPHSTLYFLRPTHPTPEFPTFHGNYYVIARVLEGHLELTRPSLEGGRPTVFQPYNAEVLMTTRNG
jgi:hypothetical protein